MSSVDEYLNPTASFMRLWEEWQKYKTLVIAYDFDNTVFDFHNKGNTYWNVIHLLRNLKELGCTMICFTANTDNEFIRNYCRENQIPLDKLNENPDFFKCDAGKIYFNALLDDRAGLRQVFDELTLLIKLIKK